MTSKGRDEVGAPEPRRQWQSEKEISHRGSNSNRKQQNENFSHRSVSFRIVVRSRLISRPRKLSFFPRYEA